MSVAVLGSGAGALAVAADFARHGREPVLADLPAFASNLDPVREQGGVKVTSGWHGARLEPVPVGEIEAAVPEAALIIVVVPAFGHEPFTQVLTPLLQEGQSLLFVGEGSGSIVARRALVAAGRSRVLVGEMNTLPYIARLAGPGAVTADRKAGGVLLAAIPAARTEDLLHDVADVWPYVSPAESVWETVLINYNAIDHVATVLANAGTIEHRTGGMLLWGEGASPSVVRVIEAVDGELLAVRAALGLGDRRRYRDFLVAQALARSSSGSLYEILRNSRLVQATTPTGPGALETRYITEDVPYALVLASSLGDELRVDTPVVDALITIAATMLGRDFLREGRTLRRLGLAGIGREGLRRFAETGDVEGRRA